jgi:hypothetical protein
MNKIERLEKKCGRIIGEPVEGCNMILRLLRIHGLTGGRGS